MGLVSSDHDSIISNFDKLSNEPPGYSINWKESALNQALKLENRGKFTVISQIDSPNGKVWNLTKRKESEAEEYVFSKIENPEDPDIDLYQELMTNNFGPESIQPIEDLKKEIEAGGVNLYVLKKDGKAVCALSGSVYDLENEDGSVTGEQAFIVGYVMTDPTSKNQGLATEVYALALRDVVENAEQGKEIKFALGECVAAAEGYWNGVGWERLYIEIRPGLIVEVRYTAPAMSYDSKSGNPDSSKEGGEPVPEHLMIDTFGGKLPTVPQLLATIRSYYSHGYGAYPRNDFDSDEAFKTYTQHIEFQMEEFSKQFSPHTKLSSLTKERRSEAWNMGIDIEEWMSDNLQKTDAYTEVQMEAM